MNNEEQEERTSAIYWTIFIIGLIIGLGVLAAVCWVGWQVLVWLS